MPIPAYMWLKDDGGADVKGSSTVQGREHSIEIISFGHGVNLPVDAANGKQASTLNHVESVSMMYNRITWHYLDGNIKFTDSWNERG